ncbi:CDF family Co(II)/Ni(II) efflux transporter DmeF [Candidatus Binatia bacterium]|nr:CDF family Co(II)/Ni(II) efflux transporter DmeF [Candidatus Binatia bacterium]
MHFHDVAPWAHNHNYLTAAHVRSERRTWQVIALTGAMMVVEIAAGSVFHSMALLADGWHMASHTSALGIAAFAYAFARRHVDDPRYSFGTWKVSVLGGFASAVVLAVIALLIAWEAGGRLWAPQSIGFNEAILVAVLGLGVNVASAYLLREDGAREDGAADEVDGGGHGSHDRLYSPPALRPSEPQALKPSSPQAVRTPAPHAHSHDHNLRAAYLHVLADALTSVLAIAALLGGKFAGWVWMDPAVGLIGAVIIGRWSFGLLGDTSRVLLDGDVEPTTARAVRDAIEADGQTRVADVHLWRVGPRDLSAIVSVVTHDPQIPDHYKAALARRFAFRHVTVEVNVCPSEECGPEAGGSQPRRQ